jgi:hypothetical protein
MSSDFLGLGEPTPNFQFYDTKNGFFDNSA